MKTFHGISSYTNSRYAVFKITTRLGDVFMKVARDEKIATVEVDAERLLDLWRGPLSSHADAAHGTVDTWPSDRKFADAEGGFSDGEWNPVPLSLVSCAFGDQGTLRFTDGVTRTIWLLTAGATRFPVSRSVDDAPLLQRLAGADGAQYRTTLELLPTPTEEEALAEMIELDKRTNADSGSNDRNLRAVSSATKL